MANFRLDFSPKDSAKKLEQLGMRLLGRCATEISNEAKKSMKGGGSDPESHRASAPGEPPNIMHGILKNSITPAKETDKLWVVGPTVRAPYARALELGAVISPKKAKALSIPVCKEAWGKSPRAFGDLHFIPNRTGGGKTIGYLVSKSLDKLMYVLVSETIIAPRPFMRPARDRVQAKFAHIAGAIKFGGPLS